MIERLSEAFLGYPSLFLICSFSGILLPFPEDLPLLFAGMHVAEGSASWWPTIFIGVAGVLVRDIIAYTLGRVLGKRPSGRRLAYRFFGRKRVLRAADMVEEYGSVTVLIGRAFVGFRAPIFVVSGAMGISFRKFLMWDTLGLLLVIPITVYIGQTTGSVVTHWMMRYFDSWGPFIVGAVICFGAGVILFRWRNPNSN